MSIIREIRVARLYVFTHCPMLLSLRLHVDFKKILWRHTEFRVQGPFPCPPSPFLQQSSNPNPHKKIRKTKPEEQNTSMDMGATDNEAIALSVSLGSLPEHHRDGNRGIFMWRAASCLPIPAHMSFRESLPTSPPICIIPRPRKPRPVSPI